MLLVIPLFILLLVSLVAVDNLTNFNRQLGPHIRSEIECDLDRLDLRSKFIYKRRDYTY